MYLRRLFLFRRSLVRGVHVLVEVLGGLARSVARLLLKVELFQVLELVVASDLHLPDVAEVHLVTSAHALFTVIVLLGRQVEVKLLECWLALSLGDLYCALSGTEGLV